MRASRFKAGTRTDKGRGRETQDEVPTSRTRYRAMPNPSNRVLES